MSPLDARASGENRDALAKTIYARIFDWLVAKVNSSIGQDPKAAALVGVLCPLQMKEHHMPPHMPSHSTAISTA